MAKQYRVNAFVRLNNAVISSSVRRGRKIGSFSLLTVRGRKSGKPIATPLAIFIQDQKRYLIASYGIVNWVRNLRAAGGEATLVCGRNIEKIRAIELEKDTAALVFREALRSGPPGIPAVIFRVYPAYSPELNPVEHIWDELREKYFYNRCFPSLECVSEALCQGLTALAENSERLRSLTNFPHLNVRR